LGHEKAVAVPDGRVGGFSVCVFLVQRKRSRGAGKGPVLAALGAQLFFREAVRTEVEHVRTFWLCFCFAEKYMATAQQYFLRRF
jgi:hypothetical protein